MEPFLSDEMLEQLETEPLDVRIEQLEALEKRLHGALADQTTVAADAGDDPFGRDREPTEGA